MRCHVSVSLLSTYHNRYLIEEFVDWSELRWPIFVVKVMLVNVNSSLTFVSSFHCILCRWWFFNKLLLELVVSFPVLSGLLIWFWPVNSFNGLFLQHLEELSEYFRFGLWWVALGVASSIGLGENFNAAAIYVSGRVLLMFSWRPFFLNVVTFYKIKTEKLSRSCLLTNY